jgi:epoxyqueuosine reductase
LDKSALTQAVKNLARERGAALVGIAPVERFDPMPPLYDAAPKGQHPRDFLPGARSVVSFAMPILPAVLNAPAVLAAADVDMLPPAIRRSYYDSVYHRVGHVLHDIQLEIIGQMIGQLLLQHGFDAMVFPTTAVYPQARNKSQGEIWQDSPFKFTSGPFSHRHAATRAGLGEFGYSNLVLTREFGPRQRFNSVVTDAALDPDPLIDKPICLRDKCRLCLKACTMGALALRTDTSHPDYRSLEHDDPNRIFIDTPAKSFPALCNQRSGREDYPILGDCMRVCPIPKKPQRLPAHLESLQPG